MTKELQSSRYIVISFLVREMGIDIVEAISLMAELEKSGLVQLESSGDLTLKELGGALWNELPQINTKLQNGIIKLPKILFEDEKYMDMKLEVKVAYSILKDRLELSLNRGWIDEEGAVF